MCVGGGAVDLLISFATLSSFSCDLLIKTTLRPCLASCQENLETQSVLGDFKDIHESFEQRQPANTVVAALYHSM